MRFRGLVASLVFAASALASTAARADVPDVVRLKDGAMYRGTIAEMVPNDHVIIVLATGETRRFEMKDVASAGPHATAEAAVPEPPPVPPPSPVHVAPESAELEVTANEPEVNLQLKVGQAELNGVGVAGGRVVTFTGQSDEYQLVCTAPCKTRLPMGTHYLGLSESTRSVVALDHPVAITGPGTLDATYTSHQEVRIAGFVLMIGGAIAGTAATLVGINSKSDCDPPIFEGASPYCRPDGTLIGVGIGITVASLLTGWILTSIRDSADLTFIPAGAPARTREGVAFDSRGMVVRF